jgi:hypothetical protein
MDKNTNNLNAGVEKKHPLVAPVRLWFDLAPMRFAKERRRVPAVQSFSTMRRVFWR